VIVNCPACQTRFRYANEGTAALVGLCSQCDESVPMQPMKRQYIILRGEGSGAERRVAIGMDDPSLAPRLQAAQSRVAATATSEDEGAFDLPPFPIEGADPFGLGGDGAPTAQQAEAAPAPVAAPREASAGPDGGLIAILLGATGLAAGYHGALWQQAEPLTGAAIGGVIGLSLGWAWIRWVNRKS